MCCCIPWFGTGGVAAGWPPTIVGDAVCCRTSLGRSERCSLCTRGRVLPGDGMGGMWPVPSTAIECVTVPLVGTGTVCARWGDGTEAVTGGKYPSPASEGRPSSVT